MMMDAGATLSALSLMLPLTALAAGFLGSLHCIGMCGTASASIALAARPYEQNFDVGSGLMAGSVASVAYATSTIYRTPAHAAMAVSATVLAFNSGRVASYAVAGAIAGGAGGLLGQSWVVGASFDARAAMFVFAHLMIVLTGLYVMGLPQLLAPLERAGGAFWTHLSRYSKLFLPMNTLPRAAMFGALWGWIPCGLVYAMLLTAIGAGGAAAGAMTMLAFGLGTLPAMMLTGLSIGSLQRWTRDSRVRVVAGGAIVGMGLVGLARTDSLASLRAFGAFCISMLPAMP